MHIFIINSIFSVDISFPALDGGQTLRHALLSTNLHASKRKAWLNSHGETHQREIERLLKIRIKSNIQTVERCNYDKHTRTLSSRVFKSLTQQSNLDYSEAWTLKLTRVTRNKEIRGSGMKIEKDNTLIGILQV